MRIVPLGLLSSALVALGCGDDSDGSSVGPAAGSAGRSGGSAGAAGTATGGSGGIDTATGWTTPANVSDDGDEATIAKDQRAACLDSGEALVTYSQESGNPFVAVYRSESGWEPPLQLGATGLLYPVDVTSDGGASALVGFRHSTLSGFMPELPSGAYWRRYASAGGFIGETSPMPELGALAMDDTTNAVSVWDATDNLFTARLDADADAWSEPVGIDPEYRPGNLVPWRAIALDSTGSGMAIWAQHTFLRASQYDGVEGTFAPAELVDERGAIGYGEGSLVAWEGGALAVWTYTDDADTTSVYGADYEQGSGWSAPVELQADIGLYAIRPALAADAAGNAIAIWFWSDPAVRGDQVRERQLLYSSQFSRSNRAFTPAAPLPFLPRGEWADFPDIASDREGNAVAIWAGTYGVHVSRFDPATGWGSEQALGGDDGHGCCPKLAVSRSGRVLATWQSGGFFTGEVWASFLSP